MTAGSISKIHHPFTATSREINPSYSLTSTGISTRPVSFTRNSLRRVHEQPTAGLSRLPWWCYLCWVAALSRRIWGKGHTKLCSFGSFIQRTGSLISLIVFSELQTKASRLSTWSMLFQQCLPAKFSVKNTFQVNGTYIRNSGFITSYRYFIHALDCLKRGRDIDANNHVIFQVPEWSRNNRLHRKGTKITISTDSFVREE
jgi:hypothetical protein